MNPLRKLWQQVAARAEDLKEGLESLVSGAPEDCTDETQVHGFYRRVTADGQKELGFGFYCPVRGGTEHDTYVKPGDRVRHCGRVDQLDPNVFLPTVRLQPRRGRYQISSDGTQAIPTDTMDKFSGDFQYEQSDPAGRGAGDSDVEYSQSDPAFGGSGFGNPR